MPRDEKALSQRNLENSIDFQKILKSRKIKEIEEEEEEEMECPDRWSINGW